MRIVIIGAVISLAAACGQGAQGPQGPTGTKGDTGSQGVPGDAGIPGGGLYSSTSQVYCNITTLKLRAGDQGEDLPGQTASCSVPDDLPLSGGCTGQQPGDYLITTSTPRYWSYAGQGPSGTNLAAQWNCGWNFTHAEKYQNDAQAYICCVRASQPDAGT